MKIKLLALISCVALFACKGNLEKTYSPEPIAANQTFDEIPKSEKAIFTLVKIDSNRADGQEHFKIQYRDTTLSVQNGKNKLAVEFRNARFVNSQNTAVVAQVVDSTQNVAPFYVFALKDGSVEVMSLDKASKGKNDGLYTQGLVELTRTNFVINNDYIVNSVSGKINTIKRQNPDERIQGKFLMYSRDKTTLVFLTEKELYQVNYRNGETQSLTVPASLLANAAGIQNEIASNYSWTTNNHGTPFLKYNGNSDRIVDISEFKK
ncbi:hypothetical protein [Pedobacter sp. BMA]|uniref:hypothetical protein n=1 Tax=Pedobacter sp. BMA TaxID=1663685 RepID=UPI00064B308B|nr:hypothetical protein [Pedobacter sp. BMA]KLT66551.1 hypothetical protein AB669_05050 [Pedobacter sp. BMA]